MHQYRTHVARIYLGLSLAAEGGFRSVPSCTGANRSKGLRGTKGVSVMRMPRGVDPARIQLPSVRCPTLTPSAQTYVAHLKLHGPAGPLRRC